MAMLEDLDDQVRAVKSWAGAEFHLAVRGGQPRRVLVVDADDIGREVHGADRPAGLVEVDHDAARSDFASPEAKVGCRGLTERRHDDLGAGRAFDVEVLRGHVDGHADGRRWLAGPGRPRNIERHRRIMRHVAWGSPGFHPLGVFPRPG